MHMNFSEKIKRYRSEAQETQAANKILDMLNQLKLGNDNTTAYRWIWELIQNAKDIVNNSGKVDILLTLDKNGEYVELSHNGRLFSTENIVFLIEQVSTKERNKNKLETKTTGKFGTGFLTTHLLSEKVNVYGILQDEGEETYKFDITLDRSGEDKASIISAIQNSCTQLDENTILNNDVVIENAFNTFFRYDLDELGLKIATEGIKSLSICAPYIFAFVPQLNSITVNYGEFEKIITKQRDTSVVMEDAVVSTITVSSNGTIENRYIFTLCEDDVSIAVEVNKKDEKNIILPFNDTLPKLFCDFPLLGTDDFAFPVVINSPLFNPTEPRDGIHLTDKEHSQINDNKDIILKALEMYSKIITYFSDKNYEGIYNITKINLPIEKKWLSCNWLEQNVTNSIKDYLLHAEILTVLNGNKVSLVDMFDDTNVFIPNDETKEVREQVWDISRDFFADKLLRKDEIEHWYFSLWGECRNYSIIDLIKRIEQIETLEELSSYISTDPIHWLNKVLEIFYFKDNKFLGQLERHPKIVPNQEGVLCSLDKVLYDDNIDESYKALSNIIHLNLKSKLLHKEINSILLPGVEKYSNQDAISELQKALIDYREPKEIGEFHKTVICFDLSTKPDLHKELGDFIVLANQFSDYEFKSKLRVTRHNTYMINNALKYCREDITSRIDNCNNIKYFAETYFSSKLDDAIKWLDSFINMLIKYGQIDLINKYTLLPNQHGIFKRSDELSLDAGDISDILKDACFYTGYDVRNDLLLSDIFYELPDNRTKHLDDIADRITNYIREKKDVIMKSDSDEKQTFQLTYLWLRDNKENPNVKKCFKELLSNLHWFYNDNEIADNIAKVEKYDSILSKYGVSGEAELEKILSYRNSQSEKIDKVIITEELLAQWGISSEDELQLALNNNIFGAEFLHNSSNSVTMFNYVDSILERSKNNILEYLKNQSDYNLSDVIEIHKTIFIVKKYNSEIYIITRPSDYDKVILYYGAELDMLDYEKDCELWVENGISQPEKITFGKMLKLTGVNKIPLRSV